jgi:lysophospholipase L1-like esterase
MKLSIRRVALPIATVFLTLLLIEIGLRVLTPVEYRAPAASSGADDAWSDLLHVPSTVPGLAYELARDRRTRMWNVEVRTNSLGMRDDMPDDERSLDMLRIAALGDSVTFGYGVAEADAWPAALERWSTRIGARACRFEVLNFGVSGYGTHDELALLRDRVMPLRPDAIVIAYHLNDPENDPVQPLQAHFHSVEWWQRLHITRGVASVFHRLAVSRLGGGDYFKYLHAEDGDKWPRVLDNFDEIRTAATSLHGEPLPIVLAIFPFFAGYEGWAAYPYRAEHQRVADAATARGWSVVDVYKTFARSGRGNVSLARDLGHPNRVGHTLAAAAIGRGIARRVPCPPSGG